MKTNRLISASGICVAWLVMNVLSAAGAPPGTSNRGLDYAWNSADLSRFIAGVHYRGMERDVALDGASETLEANKAMAYLGYEVLRWCAVYAIGGYNGTKLSGMAGDTSSAGEFGGGVALSILEHELMDTGVPVHFLFDTIRISGGAQYTVTRGKWFYSEEDWSELYAWLQLALVNRVESSKLYAPVSVALYFGPVYSDLRGDIDERTSAGAAAGLEFFFGERVSIDVGAEYLDNPRVSGGVHFRF